MLHVLTCWYSKLSDYLFVNGDNFLNQLPACVSLPDPGVPVIDPIISRQRDRDEQSGELLCVQIEPLNSLLELHWHDFTDATLRAAKVFLFVSHSSKGLK